MKKTFSAVLASVMLLLVVTTAVSAESQTEPVDRSLLDDHLREVMLQKDFFSVEGLAEFRELYRPLIRKAVADGEYIWGFFIHLADIPYALPDADAIPESEALELARTQVLSYTSHPAVMIDDYNVRISYRVYEEGKPEWRIAYYAWSNATLNAMYRAGYIPFGYVVRIDALTGDLLGISDTVDYGTYNEHGEFPDERDTLPPLIPLG